MIPVKEHPNSVEQVSATTESKREARARRQASQLELRVVKSRRNGTFMLVDVWRNVVVAPGNYNGFGYAIDMLEEELAARRGIQFGICS